MWVPQDFTYLKNGIYEIYRLKNNFLLANLES